MMHVLTGDVLRGAENVAHAFFTRSGGVSRGLYASLNCGPGSKDLREAVVENRRRAVSALSESGDAGLVTLYQIHGSDTVVVEEPWLIDNPPRADAVVTRAPGIALGILTADCAPVLLADAQAGVVGAAHAGWRGALSGVIEAVVGAMEDLGARRERVMAAVGPCIAQKNYEVGEDLRTQFLKKDSSSVVFFAAGRAGHWQFDLEAYVVRQLERASVGAIGRLSACTYSGEEEFFSFRRATLRGEPDYGRQLSAIMLKR